MTKREYVADPLEHLLRTSINLPLLVLAVDVETDQAHLIVAATPDEDVAQCGYRAPLGGWSPVAAWSWGAVCRDCVPRP